MVENVGSITPVAPLAKLNLAQAGDANVSSGSSLDARQHVIAGSSGFAGGLVGGSLATAEFFFSTAQVESAVKVAKRAGFVLAVGTAVYDLRTTKNDESLTGDQKLKSYGKTVFQTVAGIGVGTAAGFLSAPTGPGAVAIGFAAGTGASETAGYVYDYIYENSYSDDTTPWDTSPPIVLDLDGDGVELVNLRESAVFFDIDADGFTENTGWASADDGILSIDLDADGAITTADEFVFANQVAAAEVEW